MGWNPSGGGGGGGGSSQIYVWNGSTYVLSTTLKLLVGPTDPTTVGITAAQYDAWLQSQD